MDTDDCSERQKEAFLNKSMFLGHPLFEYIVPIFDSDNLEDVLLRARILPREIKSVEKGRVYLKIFPINGGKNGFDSSLEIKGFHQKMQAVKQTNMDDFVAACLELIDK